MPAMTPLPTFRFHPEPLRSGSVEPASIVCNACEQPRDHVYVGNCYVEDDFDGEVCPWCIADGTAHQRFGMTFHEAEPPSGTVDMALVDELEERTPGLCSDSPVTWPWCCDMPMAYVEPAGHAELIARHAELASMLVPQLEAEAGLTRGNAERLFRKLQRDQPPRAHVFQCLGCEVPRAEIEQD
jgi:uncharacterized protein